MVASSAMAVVLVGTTTGVVRVAKEIPNTTTTLTNGGNALDIRVLAPAGAGATGTNPVYLKVNLQNGAKFAGTPSLNCSGITGAGGATSATAGNISIQNGGAGFSNVTFVVSGDQGDADFTFNATSAYCTVSGLNVTISGLSNVGVSATFEYTDGATQASTNQNGSYITFVDSFSATYSASSGTAVVDATSGSDNFVAGSNLNSGTAILGYVQIGRNAGVANTATMGNDMNLGAALGVSSGTITIAGPAIAAMKAAASSAGVYLSSAANCGATVVKTSFQSTGADSVTFTGLTTANMEGLYACGVVSGGTQQILTGQLTGLPGGNTAATTISINYGSAGNIQNVAQNGKSKNAFFVNASTSASKTSIIRLVNTGGVSGTLRATAYLIGDGVTGTTPNVDGTQVGTANSVIGTLAAGQSLSMTSAQLEALLGYTPASGTVKYRVVFSGGLTDFKVLNYTKDVVGGYITTSQYQDD
jgi:hypothetical protein